MTNATSWRDLADQLSERQIAELEYCEREQVPPGMSSPQNRRSAASASGTRPDLSGYQPASSARHPAWGGRAEPVSFCLAVETVKAFVRDVGRGIFLRVLYLVECQRHPFVFAKAPTPQMKSGSRRKPRLAGGHLHTRRTDPTSMKSGSRRNRDAAAATYRPGTRSPCLNEERFPEEPRPGSRLWVAIRLACLNEERFPEEPRPTPTAPSAGRRSTAPQ